MHSCTISNEKVCAACATDDLRDEYTTLHGRGRPTRCVKLKVALSGITDSFWVVTDNYAGYARILSLLGVTQPVATLTKKSRGGESSLTNAMQRRLRQVLAPIPWGVDKVAAALVSPASCGQSRRGMLHRTARQCSQDSLQKAAMSIRPYEARLSTGPSPLWD